MEQLTRERVESDTRSKKTVKRLRQDLANERREIERRAALRVKEVELDLMEKERVRTRSVVVKRPQSSFLLVAMPHSC